MEIISRNRCTACSKVFENEAEQRAHYKSDWHSHNLRRKVAGVPSVTESIFNLRLQSLEAEKKSRETKMIYTCVICNKSYGSAKAHAQHLQSKLHLSKAEDGLESAPVLRPAPVRVQPAALPKEADEEEYEEEEEEEEDDEDDEWEEVAEGEVDIQSLEDEVEEMAVEDSWNTAKCFICDAVPDGTLEGCLEHMHKVHGLFVPDVEFLKDPHGLVNYLGLKVTKGFACLYCEEKHFQNVVAARKHMIAKSHCKLRYEDTEGDIPEELEEFYDFSSSYEELPLADREDVSLDSGGYELIIKGPGDVTKTIGNREFHRYYKQRVKPPVESDDDDETSIPDEEPPVEAVVSKYRSMGLATRQGVHPKETKHLPSVKLEVMRSKLGLKNNVIRNLPKNCTH